MQASHWIQPGPEEGKGIVASVVVAFIRLEALSVGVIDHITLCESGIKLSIWSRWVFCNGIKYIMILCYNWFRKLWIFCDSGQSIFWKQPFTLSLPLLVSDWRQWQIYRTSLNIGNINFHPKIEKIFIKYLRIKILTNDWTPIKWFRTQSQLSWWLSDQHFHKHTKSAIKTLMPTLSSHIFAVFFKIWILRC